MPNKYGYYTPPKSGTLPKHGKKILKTVYSAVRRNHPSYPKSRAAKIAWGAVRAAGYRKKSYAR